MQQYAIFNALKVYCIPKEEEEEEEEEEEDDLCSLFIFDLRFFPQN